MNIYAKKIVIGHFLCSCQNINHNSTAEKYHIAANEYLSSLEPEVSKRMKRIVTCAEYFLSDIYGYSPSASEIKRPVLNPNNSEFPERLVPFHEAWARQRTDSVVHFYIDDDHFLRLFRNPEKYIPFLKECRAVLGTDLSQYSDMPSEMRFRHAICNMEMTHLLQENGVNVIPNITWTLTDSFQYSFPSNLRRSTIAINSNGVHRTDIAKYRWKRGYRVALKELQPLRIIRYGLPFSDECTSVSKYFINERLNALRNGSKR